MIRGLAALTSAGTIAVAQYFVHQPWRYMLMSIELVVLSVVVAILWGRMKDSEARLEAITEVVQKSHVIHEANRIIDAVAAVAYEHEAREVVESGE